MEITYKTEILDQSLSKYLLFFKRKYCLINIFKMLLLDFLWSFLRKGKYYHKLWYVLHVRQNRLRLFIRYS